MQSLMFWAIGWIGFVLLAADVFQQAKKPRKVKTGLHLWLAPGSTPARKQATHNSGRHWCYSPAA